MAILELIEEDDTKQKSPFLVDPTKKDFDSLSLQEKQALLDQLTAEANDPALLDSLAKQLLQQDTNTVTIQPHAGYVCKTHVVNSKNKDIAKNKVVYINICYDNAIPEPPLASEKEIQLGLQADPNATYQVPLSMGEKRLERDYIMMDACVNTQPYLRSEKDLDFRLYLLELAMEYVEEALSVDLSREFTMPNMPSKGTIPSRILRLPKQTVNPNKQEWKLQPKLFNKQNTLFVEILMPDNNAKDWSVDITHTSIELTIQGQNHVIPLNQSIDVNSKSNKVDYFKRSKILLIQLELNERRQYL